MAAPAPAVPRRWLYRPLPDLMLGCGLWYALALAVLSVAGSEVRTGGGAALLPFLVLAFGTPHYGATLVRVYERREDRRAYTLFTVWASALLAGIFVVGVHDLLVGSVILTVYLTWSPWHYTGQNYGIAVMFLRRRGVPLERPAKRLLYASFLLSYVLTFVAMHSGAQGAASYSPLAAYDAQTYQFLSLGLPQPYADWTFAALLVAYLTAVVGAAITLLRRAPLRDLAPAAALTGTQAIWFSIPLVLRHWHVDAGIEPWAAQYGTYYFMWIAIAHSIQYLWITSYYAKGEPGWSGQLGYYVKVMLAGTAIWTVPALLFAPSVLGRLPFDGGLGVLIAAGVNIHHFVLDGAIWKLRDGRVARILLRSREAATAEAGAPGRRWLRPLIYATGAICFVITFTAKWEKEFGVRRGFETGDLARVDRALSRLGWFGRDNPGTRVLLGQMYAQRGDPSEALREYQASLAIHPTPDAWRAVGGLLSQQGQWQPATEAYRASLDLDERQEMVHHELGLAWLKLDRPDRARDAFARAAALNPERKIHQTLLERAERAAAEAAGADPPGAADAGSPPPGRGSADPA